MNIKKKLHIEESYWEEDGCWENDLNSKSIPSKDGC
jgi:hypothetical protein